jgi:hypothetical protein
MEAQELMIGNLGHLTTEGHEHEPDLIEWEIGDFEFYEDRMDDVKPIPLTEEWLFKLGFVKDKVDNTYYFNDLTILLPNYFSWKGCLFYHTKHVHQLQNLVFALTGEKLSLNEQN